MAERIAIFGGTFDPIHVAHLRTAVEVAEQFKLKKVLIMPSANPPHHKSAGADVVHRLEMVRLATEQSPLLEASDFEAERGGRSYTVDTLAEVAARHPSARLFFLIGADAFFYVHTWRKPEAMFELADFVVMDRPGTARGDLLEYLRGNLHPSFQLAEKGWVRCRTGHGAKRVQTRLMDISSTDIKSRVAKGLSITYLVPPRVEDYIYSMKLYRRTGV
jgi:nicotinate-nucleotide adenylyltransferase